MEKIHLFLYVCLICALISFTIISDYTSGLQVKRTRFFTTFQNNSLLDFDKVDKEDEVQERRMKIVIWLNPRLSGDMEYRRNFVKEKMIIPQNTGNECFREKYKCEMTLENDEKTLREADAILFLELAYYFEMNDLPPNWQNWRRPEQIWAVQIDESPTTHPPTLLEVFNWTVSYRQDSDIWLPYGKTVSQDNPNLNDEIMIGLNNDIPLSKWFKWKSKLVTGVVSNCYTQSKREVVLAEMMKGNKSVDIYGGCGNTDAEEKCGFYGGDCTRYWDNLARKYKFYLAFENSLCVDYVTEKFWRTLKLGMVPVVYGGADYGKLAPKGSYVDVRWFKSGEELMSFLERVGGDEVEYAKFFEWRRGFEVREEGTRYMTNETGVWCEFCEKLRGRGKKGGIGVKMVRRDWWSRLDGFSGIPCATYESVLNWRS